MAGGVGQRFTWAVSRLGVEPADRLLEVGCGHGIAVSLVSERLDGGAIVAIDRSEAMVAAAMARNTAAIEAGIATFHACTLQDYARALDPGAPRFDKVFAINVNAFWVKPGPEFAAVRSLIARGGRLFLFFEPPNDAKAEEVAEKLDSAIPASGFAIVNRRIEPLGRAMGLCFVAQLDGA